MKVGKCQECSANYQEILKSADEDEIIKSVVDSRRTAKREIEIKVEWDERDDMVQQLLKQFINKEITIDEYKMLVEDIKEVF